jgi:hypothetical protein
MPILVAAIFAFALAQDTWPAERVESGSYHSPSLKSELLDVPDPKDETKTVKAQVHTFIAWMLTGSDAPPDSTEVARTCNLNQGKQVEPVELLSETSVTNLDGTALSINFALSDAGIDTNAAMPTVTAGLQTWTHMHDAKLRSEPVKFEVTWNPYSNGNAQALVDHDVGYKIYKFPLHCYLMRQYKIGDKVYTLSQSPIPSDSVRVMKSAQKEPLATRVIIPDKAEEDNRTGFYTTPWQEKLPGISYPGGWAGLISWQGGDVGSSDLKIGDLKGGPYWNGFAGGSMTMGGVFTGDGMSRINFNPGAISAGLGTIQPPNDMYFPGGTLFVPNDPRYQVLMAGQNFSYRKMVGLFATTNPQLPPNQGYTLCTQMTRLEPTNAVTYLPVAPPNSIFTAIARMSDEAIFKGPAEQARVWIYTNKASFTEINDKLIPGVNARQYVNCLSDVARLGGLTAKDMETAKLFEPRLLGASGLSPKVAAWFYDHLITSWPKETRAALVKPGAELTKLVAAGAKPDDLKSAAAMTAYLMENGNADVRIGAMTYLMAVPDENVAALAALKPLRVGMVQNSANAEERGLFEQVKVRYAISTGG